MARLGQNKGLVNAAMTALSFAMIRHLAGFLTSALAVAASPLLQPPAQAQQVDVAIVLAADVSRSIDEEEFALQRRGYAAAVTSARFLRAVASGPRGAVALHSCLSVASFTPAISVVRGEADVIQPAAKRR
jgi:Protein of unknown function (DUF1194)